MARSTTVAKQDPHEVSDGAWMRPCDIDADKPDPWEPRSKPCEPASEPSTRVNLGPPRRERAAEVELTKVPALADGPVAPCVMSRSDRGVKLPSLLTAMQVM